MPKYYVVREKKVQEVYEVEANSADHAIAKLQVAVQYEDPKPITSKVDMDVINHCTAMAPKQVSAEPHVAEDLTPIKPAGN